MPTKREHQRYGDDQHDAKQQAEEQRRVDDDEHVAHLELRQARRGREPLIIMTLMPVTMTAVLAIHW